MGEIVYDKTKDSYQILGISPTSSDEEIKKRYRELAKLYHPDSHPNSSEEKMKEITEAYTNLKEKNRPTYDRLRKQSLGIKGKIDSALNGISEMASSLAFKFMNSSEIASLEAYDDYINFLEEIEPKYQEYGESTNQFIEGVTGKRGKLSKETLEQYQTIVIRELEHIKRRAQAFDDFQIFYKQVVREMEKLHNKTITFEEITKPENRTKYQPSYYEKKKSEINKIVKELNEKRLALLNSLKVELAKRYIRYNDFLSLRGLNEETLSVSQILKLKEILPLIDQLKIILSKQRVAIEDYLINMGLNIMTVTKEELESILDGINGSIYSTNLTQTDTILKEENTEKSARTK